MREAIIRRPLVPAAAGLLLGVVAVNNWFAAILFLSLLVLFRELRACLICGAAFAIGAVIAPDVRHPIFERQFLSTEATVVSVPKLYTTETVAEIRVGTQKLMMSTPPTVHVQLGETIRIRGYAKPLTVGSERLADRNVVSRIWVDRIESIRPAPWIARIGNGWRDSFVAFVDRTLPTRSAAAVEAVCFNVQSRLDENDREAISRAGTVHAISVSGLHVGVLALVLFAILSLLPIPRAAQLGVIAGVLILYCIASGMNAPVLRASLMSIMIAAAYLFRREPDFLSAVAAAAILQLFLDATAVYDAGFQLTFVALTVVAFFGTRSKHAPSKLDAQLKYRVKHQLGRACLIALAAAPIMAYDFGTLSIPSIGANALTVLTIPFLVVFAMLAHLISFLSVAIATGIMIGVVEPLSGWLLFVTDWLGGEWAQLSIPAFSGYWLIAIYGLLLLVWRMRLRPA